MDEKNKENCHVFVNKFLKFLKPQIVGKLGPFSGM